MNFSGKTALVTGGTRGIGRAIAETLLAYGAEVIATGTDQNQVSQLNTTAQAGLNYVALDLNEADSVKHFIEYIQSIETIDVFINNAGINRIERIENISSKNFNDVLDINLRSPFFLTQAVAEKMIQQESGKIINIASIWSKVTKEGRVSYIVSKSAIDGLTRGLSTDLARHNVLVNTVSPGFVMTELTDQSLSDAEKLELQKTVPMNRFATPDEIANVVSFLCSDLNTYITGQNIVVDGGYTNV